MCNLWSVCSDSVFTSSLYGRDEPNQISKPKMKSDDYFEPLINVLWGIIENLLLIEILI